MFQPPKFRIINAGHRYHLYLGHGHRLAKNFGKIAENCTTALGLRYTLLRFPMRNLIKLHFSKGLNFFNSFSHNFYFKNFVEPRWLIDFQRVFSFPKKMDYYESLVSSDGTYLDSVSSEFFLKCGAITNNYDFRKTAKSYTVDTNATKFPFVLIDSRGHRGSGHPFGTQYYAARSLFSSSKKMAMKKKRALASWTCWIQLSLAPATFSLSKTYRQTRLSSFL